MESTRPVSSAELVAEALQALGVMLQFNPNATQFASSGSDRPGRDPSNFEPADFAVQNILHISAVLRPLVRCCCCCIAPLVARDINHECLNGYNGLRPRFGPLLQLENTSDLTNPVDVEVCSGAKHIQYLPGHDTQLTATLSLPACRAG